MSIVRVITMTSLLALCAGSAFAVEKVGSTVSAQQTIEGQGAVGDRTIATADPIYRDERLRANQTGLGQFELGDGTKLVLGRNAQITVDKFVTGGGGRPAEIALNAVAGSFRFITGHLDKNAYRILTPQGTIGVRGTAFEGTIVGTQINLLLMNGQVWFCNRNAPPGAMPLKIEPTADMPAPMADNNCRWLNNPCELLVADAYSPIDQPRIATEVYTPEQLKDLFPISDREDELVANFRLDSAACLGVNPGSAGGAGGGGGGGPPTPN
jgi:FecR protein